MRTEDGYIIHKCLDGDAAAFGLLVEKYKKGIYALAYAKIGNFHDAQDITQEVFISAYQNLRTLRRWDNFMGWLYRITTNQCKMLIRSRSRRPDREFVEDQEQGTLDQPSIDSYTRNGAYESIREALDSLPEMYRQILTLRYFGGMTTVEMSRFLGVSPATIKRRLREARGQLKEGVLDMMNTAYEQHQLPANFTFRIVEMVKRIKIHAMPRSTGLPWGLSLAAGIAVVVMTFGSQMAIYKQPTPLTFPSETETLKVREMSVDILSVPGTPLMASKQGNTDGAGIDQRRPESNSFLAPAKGGGTWTQKADMPTARYTAGSAVVDGKIYVIGGNPVGASFTEVVEEYNPATNTWMTRADMPTSRQGVAAAAVDGIIYAIGGWNNSNGNINPRRPFMSVVEAYDPATDMWTTKADMPTARDDVTVSVVDGKIYVIGGMGQGAGPGGVVAFSIVEAYDPATDTWTKKANKPTARWFDAACVMDGRIYVSGGTSGWPVEDTMSTMEVYDPVTDTWTQASDMPRPRMAHSASVLDGRVYIVGGHDYEVINEGKLDDGEVDELFSIVDVYDPVTDTWTTAASLPTSRSYHTAAVVDGKIFAIGGTHGPATRLSEVYEYDPGLPYAVSTVKPERKVLTTWGQVRSVE